jgi:hypothetical protein
MGRFVSLVFCSVCLYACGGSVRDPDRSLLSDGGAGGALGQGGELGGAGGASDGGAGGAGGAACLPQDACACDDGDPCTLDEHPPGYCTHAWICGGAGGAGGAS